MPATENPQLIILWSDGMISVAYEPDGNIQVVVGEPPPEELADILDSARALADASMKAPALRERYIAELEDLLRTHAAQLRKFCGEQMLAGAA